MKIEFITGVMGAGKSADLIESVEELMRNGHNVAVVKVALNTQGKFGHVKSRNGNSVDCLVVSVKLSEAEMLASLSFYIEQHLDAEYLFIDESQFLNGEQINAIETAAAIFGLNLKFYGLATDFTGKKFIGTEFIEKIADSTYIIPSKCETTNCNNNAEFNARIVGGRIVTEGETIVEDKDVYKAICMSCLHKFK